ncbi:MAG: NADH-quinone oxidoreductase subunit NuoB [Fervidicoccaceae archaeon]
MGLKMALLSSLERTIKRITKPLLKPASPIIEWATKYSIWPVHFTTSCCGCEFAASYGPRLDTERLGSLPFTHVRNTNSIIIEGTITRKMAKALKVVYEQMPSPKFVVAMGACAIDGGIFFNSYNIVRPREILPIEVYIPGCPPRPEAVTNAVSTLQKRMTSLRLATKQVLQD